MGSPPLYKDSGAGLIDGFLRKALEEDIGSGDVTTGALVPDRHFSGAVMVAKEECILAGLPFAERTFHLVDTGVKFRKKKKEGRRVRKGEIIAEIRGRTGSLLAAERTALNLLQRLSGIATLTRKYVEALEGLETKITDTRKTAPGLRYFDKYAVRAGGGTNHRYGLSDGVLIKDNHISAAGGAGRSIKLARMRVHHLFKIEVETRTLNDVKEALEAGADVIMLDNMPLSRMRKAVDLIRSAGENVIIEASGNIHLENVRAVAGAGPDIISVGALTHSAAAVDISINFD